MSISVDNASIKYGEKTNIIVKDLNNVTFNDDDSILKITESIFEYIAIVEPKVTTIYYISGYNNNNIYVTLNVTIYVNTTTLKDEYVVDYNNSVILDVIGVDSYKWYPTKYLNKSTGNNVICTPKEDITYRVIGKDFLSTLSTVYINVKVNTKIKFTPENPTVLNGNLLKIEAQYEDDNNFIYRWESMNFQGIKKNCIYYKYGNILTLNPYENIEYKLSILSNNQIISEDKIKINVKNKPSNILDIDTLPYILYDDVINRNRKSIIDKLNNNKELLNKIINFYYITLQNAYRFQWTNKNGIPFKIKWNTVGQNINESNGMILNFWEQWNFFAFINQRRIRPNEIDSNFAYLLNIINEIYLEKPKKIYITPI